MLCSGSMTGSSPAQTLGCTERTMSKRPRRTRHPRNARREARDLSIVFVNPEKYSLFFPWLISTSQSAKYTNRGAEPDRWLDPGVRLSMRLDSAEHEHLRFLLALCVIDGYYRLSVRSGKLKSFSIRGSHEFCRIAHKIRA